MNSRSFHCNQSFSVNLKESEEKFFTEYVLRKPDQISVNIELCFEGKKY